MKTEKLGGVAGGEGECGDDVAGWLVRERRSLDILPVMYVVCLVGFSPGVLEFWLTNMLMTQKYIKFFLIRVISRNCSQY